MGTVTAALREKRSTVVAQLKQLQSETEPIVKMFEDPETTRQMQSTRSDQPVPHKQAVSTCLYVALKRLISSSVLYSETGGCSSTICQRNTTWVGDVRIVFTPFPFLYIKESTFKSHTGGYEFISIATSFHAEPAGHLSKSLTQKTSKTSTMFIIHSVWLNFKKLSLRFYILISPKSSWYIQKLCSVCYC